MAVNVVIGLAVIAVGVVAFWVWLPIARYRLHQHQEPGPAAAATMELRDEPPALVGLLVNELELSPDAFAATLLDLAARGHIEIIQVGPETNVLRRRRSPDEPVRPFETQVLTIIDTAVGVGVGTADSAGTGGDVAVKAITGAVGGGSAFPWMNFATAVRHDGHGAGLTTPAAPIGTGVLMLLDVVVCVGVAIAVPEAFLLTAFLFVGLLLPGLYLASRGRTTVLTAEGRTAAQHWLGVRDFIEDHGEFEDLPPAAVAVWDRYVAYAAAMGLSDAAVDALVAEVRTSLSIRDVVTTGIQVRRMYRTLRDPKKAKAWQLEQLRARFGPDLEPGEVFGPEEGGDFWALVDRTGAAWGIAMLSLQSDRGPWLAAAHRRIDSLVAAAPPELAADVRTVAAPAHVYVTLMAGAGGSSGAELENPFDDPDVRAAGERLLPVVARHLGVQPNGAAVQAALLAKGAAPPPSTPPATGGS